MLKKLVPQLQVNTIYDIDLNELWKQGKRGIITDLDNTLVGAKAPLATPELIDWLKVVSQIGFQVIIVSNNNKLRVSQFAEPLSLPFIYRAKKPTRAAFHKAMHLMNLRPEQTVVIGDQMMTDVLGGNRMGLYTILVLPIARKDEGFFTKVVNRNLEKAALTWIRK
ncbi:YqeG family HAD IIIA-type phosphatase [Paenibacillus doosanensis]|uniref:UMP phosphatase n=1 Tax=Paenibacillus konkukensis TaxID=2020716 RepID=A0ABY4RYL5_9BACL|nr:MULTISPECIES: YqeG family HAD IIIA-type phosphatase [Paenibacillus]MCS7458542.1 YqeG family HAD IIIA-type phosphatase [Paenibacillus doosanensis]UQZ86935.1 UMP phosphatase [Paenibacillus konkukensis]